MITQAVAEEDLEKLSSYEYLVERAKKYDTEVPQLEKALEEKDLALEEKDLALEEKENIIAKMKSDNKKLKEQLAFYGK